MTIVEQVVKAEPLLVPRVVAAEMVGLSLTEFDDERRAGRIFCKKYGRKVLAPMDELKRYVESLPWDQTKD
ncbi:DNA-binding protein [Mycobacteroides abscessus]|uniref:DNA-binding protein n=1 Tax=Mycobacteroides abscessus TaxID=36809 RepID=UPI00189645AB|nr:DNA-binding protein [Mycobacteroides abscessus]